MTRILHPRARRAAFPLAVALVAAAAWGCDDRGAGCDHDGCDGGCDGCDCDDDGADAGDPGGEPTPLTDFASLMASLEGGHDVRAVLRYANCTLDGAGPGPDAVGGMTVDAFEYFAAGAVYNDTAYVLFSETVLISIGSDYVYNYVKVRVYEDLEVEVIAQYLDPITFAVEMNETFACPFDTGDVAAPGLSLYEL